MALDGILRPPFAIPLQDCVKVTGQPNAAAAASGIFGLIVTNPGTTAGTTILNSETANASTKTDLTMFTLSMPNETHEGDRASLYIGAYKVVAASAVGTVVLSASVRELNAGVLGPELEVSIANGGTISATAAGTETEVVVNVGNLGAGDQLQAVVKMVITETATHDLNGVITSLRFADTSDTTPDA